MTQFQGRPTQAKYLAAVQRISNGASGHQTAAKVPKSAFSSAPAVRLSFTHLKYISRFHVDA